jgi:putative transcriptional regulator
MECLVCGSKMNAKKNQLYHYTISGLSNIYLRGITVNSCSCGEEEVEIPRMDELHQVIADDIAKQENKLLAEEVKFLRKHLGFSGKDFANFVKVAPETVSRWENGTLDMSETLERFLRLMVLARKHRVTNYAELDKMAEKPKTNKKKILEVDHSHWQIAA